MAGMARTRDLTGLAEPFPKQYAPTREPLWRPVSTPRPPLRFAPPPGIGRPLNRGQTGEL